MHEFRSLQQPYGDKWDEFSQWDTNNDGVISRDEFHDARQRALGEQGGERQCDCLSYFVFLLPSFVVSSHLLVARCSVFLLCSAPLNQAELTGLCRLQCWSIREPKRRFEPQQISNAARQQHHNPQCDWGNYSAY